jgi:hypothetical protein
MSRRAFPSMAVAVAALVVALGGSALADPIVRAAAKFTRADGKRIVKVIPKNSLTGRQINESKLKLPKPPTATRSDTAQSADSATTARTADSATTAQTAGSAANADRAADADKLDGKDATEFAGAGELKFAVVNSAGTLVRQRGGAIAADIVNAAEHTYRVTFSSDVSGCAFTAAPTGAASSNTLAVEGGDDPKNVRVDADSATGFHLQVIC